MTIDVDEDGPLTINQIAEIAGGVGSLAEIMGVRWSTVCGYRRTQRGTLPIHHARVVSEALNIPLWRIRPDIWPHPAAEQRHLVTA